MLLDFGKLQNPAKMQMGQLHEAFADEGFKSFKWALPTILGTRVAAAGEAVWLELSGKKLGYKSASSAAVH